jgi:hypothetical protein
MRWLRRQRKASRKNALQISILCGTIPKARFNRRVREWRWRMRCPRLLSETAQLSAPQKRDEILHIKNVIKLSVLRARCDTRGAQEYE